MITWITFWPVLTAPTILMTLLATIKTFTFNGKTLGGGPIREYYLNHLVLPLVPSEVGLRLVEWFAGATAVQEWFFAVAVAVNVNAVLLPLLYGLGATVISISGWFARMRINQRRSSVR